MGGLHTLLSKSLRGRKAISIPLSDGDSFSSVPIPQDVGIFSEAKQSIIKLVELFVERAHVSRASDIHIDPCADSLRIRLRIDGALQDAHVLPLSIHTEIISRIKILSGMRIDEHYSAQDGRFRLDANPSSKIDVRVSVVPTYYGENAVLRLLSESAEEYTLPGLGFTSRNRETIARALLRPYGMILATGPTGSGKTTSMYTLVKMLNDKNVSIVTLEDPIEYSITGISQIQINQKTGLSFATGLRSILRQDPNIIMVGEIRDEETARLAVNTALTGHRILSTLHTNDAASSVARLLDMGVEPYLIASTVSVVIGQRLVRRLCEHCKESYILSDAERASLLEVLPGESIGARSTFYRARGCAKCADVGFFGRIGIHEVMEVTGAVRDAILTKEAAHTIRSIAIEAGMVSMDVDGFRKAARGMTSLEEMLRIRYE